MDFAFEQGKPSKHPVGIGFVVLLHVGLVYVFAAGLMNKISPHKFPPSIPVFPPEIRPTPSEPTKPILIKDPLLTNVSIPIPDVKIMNPVVTEPVVEAHGKTDDHPGPSSNTDDGKKGPITDGGKGGTPAKSVSTTCANYPAISTWLGERFSAIADREGFADKGIRQFDMTVTLTIGAAGEIINPQVVDSTNATASRAMQSAVLAGMRQLKCKGGATEASLNLPLSFTLAD